ncbi:TlpA disulfide reductase family protein [Planctomycetota bacterium]
MYVIRFMFAIALVASTFSSAVWAQQLTIGSDAPDLDIEHWVQDGEGKFKPVTTFEKGKVYVVEFWATWCPPCVASMPHLAELQTKYADQGVQIVSISDEPLDTVTAFLEKNVPESEKTFAELTRVYCLTTDPDGSSQASYMAAAEQRGIPTSFIVGKDAHIEWIGHPMKMDEPLASVVADKWDRAGFLAKFAKKKEIEITLSKITATAGKGDFESAISKIDELLKEPLIETEEFARQKQSVNMFRPIFVVLSGSPEGVKLMEKDAEQAGDDWAKNTQVGLNAFRAFEMNKDLPEDAAKQYLSIGLEAIKKADELRPDNLQIMQAYAFLLHRNGDLDKAIETQTRFVDRVRGRMKTGAEKLLAEMKEEQSAQEEDQ